MESYRMDEATDRSRQVAPDVEQIPLTIANAYLVGWPGASDGDWTLVDAGIPGSAGRIRRAAERRFGPNARPNAIVLTHAHFDHVGGLEELAREWDVPVYAHPMEFPYLDGRAAYPPPDPTVGGGAMTRLSPLYPRGPVDVAGRLRPLPVDDAELEMLPGWRCIQTPGHSPGHVSFFRVGDRVVLAGDAFIATKQESALAVLNQRPQMHGPPMYFTHDWGEARASVQRLAALEPAVAATGHGPVLRGAEMNVALHELAQYFDQYAVPRDGRYVREPVRFAPSGMPLYVPPPVPDALPKLAAGLGFLVLTAAILREARERTAARTGERTALRSGKRSQERSTERDLPQLRPSYGRGGQYQTGDWYRDLNR